MKRYLWEKICFITTLSTTTLSRKRLKKGELMTPSALSGVFLDPARRSTPATEQAHPDQVRNNQGGFAFEINDMERAKRFLILGSESSFYQAGSQLSLENAKALSRIAKSDQAAELVNLIVDISVSGRAPKQSPGLFALAVVINQAEDDAIKSYAYSKLSEVARTASTLFEFTGYLNQFQGLGGMGFHKAIGRWYNEKTLDDLAYQMVKYRSRNGYDHSRLLRLSKRVKSNDRPELGPLLNWALGKDFSPEEFDRLPRVVQGFELAKYPNGNLPEIIRGYGLSWEMLPTEALNDVKVWDALLDGNVPLGALIRQLPRLTNLGIISRLGGRTAEIEDRLRDAPAIKKARIHPLQALVAMRTYAGGYGTSQRWEPVYRIVDALEETFYLGFNAVEPTRKTHMLALDVSGSMDARISGMPVTAREASAVMAMVQARIEPEYLIVGFASKMRIPTRRVEDAHLSQLGITKSMRLMDVVREIERLPFGGTDISLPMEEAITQGLDVDAFVVYTDNELGTGRRHPFQALAAYRREMNKPNAKLIVAAMTATKFSVADPRDPGMLDIAGFDTAAPGLMAEFVR